MRSLLRGNVSDRTAKQPQSAWVTLHRMMRILVMAGPDLA